ncbi:AMP-binding protein [Streptomyces sviceus]|uniref:AMP-binding protein n=1 Tax=Streptomyces sviceus TaxID=285530 RepID=UPI0036C3FF8C
MNAAEHHWPLTAVHTAVHRTPHAPAVVEGGGALSYGDLWDRIRHWADRMAALGAAPNSVIALVSTEPAAIPAAWLGARAVGLIPLLLDPRLPAAEMNDLLTTARPAAVADLARGLLDPTAAGTARVLHPDAGYLVFSSGSQGKRKGIVGSEKGLRHFVEWEIDVLGLRSRPHRVPLLTSPSFDVVLREFLPVLCSGGELHVPEPSVAAVRARIVPWLAEEGIEVVHAVPGLASRWAAAANGGSLPRLRWTLFAGEPLYDAHVRNWRRVAPGTEILNLYGPSETTLAKFWYRVGTRPRPGAQPVGRPLPGTSMCALALRPGALPTAAGKDLPHRGEPFEIEISTPHGSLGYLDDAAPETSPLRRTSDGITTFVTGDRGRLDDDGLLVVEGRLDSLVKRRGKFVDCARIEQTARSLAGVTAACCVQVHADGSGDLALYVAGLPAAEDGPAWTRGLRRTLARELGPDVPDRIITQPELPLLPNGKVDRRALLHRAQSGALPV